MKMFKESLIVALVLVTVLECAPARRGFKIFNGDKINGWGNNHYKFIVMLFGKSICTGSIYNPLVILSAGHCFMGNKDLLPKYTALEHTNEEGAIEKHIQIQQFFIPGAYVKLYHQKLEVNGEDCSVVKLAQAINTKTSKHKVLPFFDAMPPPGSPVIIVGYGVDKGAKGDAGILRSGRTKLAQCRNRPTDDRLCITGLKEFNYQRSDQGDSGGPLLFGKGMRKLYGIGFLSGGIFYTDGYTEVVYSSYHRHRDFVKNHGGINAGSQNLPLLH